MHKRCVKIRFRKKCGEFLKISNFLAQNQQRMRYFIETNYNFLAKKYELKCNLNTKNNNSIKYKKSFSLNEDSNLSSS